MPLTTPVGMGMFPNLFVARSPAPNQDPRFSIILLFDENAQKDARYLALKQGVVEAIDKMFGAGKGRDANWLRANNFRNPFQDAGLKQKYSGFTPGKTFISPWSKTKPGIVDGRLQPVTAPADIWAGQLFRCTVQPFAFNVSGNMGASFMLDNVQLVNPDMPRMDGRQEASKAFDPIDDSMFAGAMAGAGTVSRSDDIPF